MAYYVYARSVVFDGDLDLANDFQLSYPTAGEHFASKRLDQIKTATGRTENLFAIGAPLLWLPWLAILRLAAEQDLVAGLGRLASTGYEPFFIANIAMFSALIGFLAFAVSYWVAQSLTQKWIALAAALTLMFATPLLHYQFREPMYSHTASALTVALLVAFWWYHFRDERLGVWQGAGLGALIGLAGLARWQNLAYLALPLVAIAYRSLHMKADATRHSYRATILYLIAVGLGAIAVFALQLAVWRVLFGAFVTVPQGSAFMDWRASYLAPFLFSSFRGLLPWMPIFFLALIGLFAIRRRWPQLAWPLLAMLLLAVYINASTTDWFAGGGYGPRRLTSELVILVVGYAGFINLMPAPFRRWIALLTALLLAMHQWLLLRYGLVQQLGGTVLSMGAPTFEWQDEPLPAFFANLAHYAPRFLADPRDTLLLAGSPLDTILRQQAWPSLHLTALLSSLVFAGLLLGCLFALRYAGRFIPAHRLAVGLLLPLLFAQLWILLSA